VSRPIAGDRGTPPRSPHTGRLRDERPVSAGGSYPRRHRASRHLLSEERAGFDRGQDHARPEADGEGQGALQPVVAEGAHDRDPMDRLAAALDLILGRHPDELEEAEISAELEGLERANRRIGARLSRLASALANRRAKTFVEADRARGGRADAGRLAQQAVREVRRELSEELDWTPSEAKRAVELGRRLGVEGSEGSRRAFEDGDLSARHASLLADTLRWFDDPDLRAEVEAELLEAARHQHAVEFGRTCRRLLAERDQAAAMKAEDRRKARRSARLSQTEDGFQALSGQWSGVDGELVATGVQAFRRPDAPDERRTPEQATADAVVAMAAAALRAGEAPTVRGVRPHVTVSIDYEDVLRRAGVAETRWSGPLPTEEIRRLLADCGVSRLLLDARGVALEAGEEVRNVPAGVARAIGQRDLVCIADGCDMPADWCEVMHLETPFTLGGRLKPTTGAHGCTYHHECFDRRGWLVTWVGDRPILHHPDRIPEAVRNADPADVRVVRSGLPAATSRRGRDDGRSRAGSRRVSAGEGAEIRSVEVGDSHLDAGSEGTLNVEGEGTHDPPGDAALTPDAGGTSTGGPVEDPRQPSLLPDDPDPPDRSEESERAPP
jgi:hypothetical protein